VAAWRCCTPSRWLKDLKGDNADIQFGVDIVRKAIQSPAKQIAENAGVDGAVIVGKLLESDDQNWGYDAYEGVFCDLVAKGIIDPTKVVRTALQDAASVASPARDHRGDGRREAREEGSRPPAAPTWAAWAAWAAWTSDPAEQAHYIGEGGRAQARPLFRVWRVPDIFVSCVDGSGYSREPRFIVEILSPSTEKDDRTAKLDFYKTFASLQTVLFVWQDTRRVELHERSADAWIVRDRIGSGTVQLADLGIALTMDEIYAA
jgi:hypothetical protein